MVMLFSQGKVRGIIVIALATTTLILINASFHISHTAPESKPLQLLELTHFNRKTLLENNTIETNDNSDNSDNSVNSDNSESKSSCSYGGQEVSEYAALLLQKYMKGNDKELEKLREEKNKFKTLLQDDGSFVPCESEGIQSVAILVPFRGRYRNLDLFLAYMHPYLMGKNINYKIYVITQAYDKKEFNRAMLLNIGFVLAMKEKHWDCFMLHDVDLLPESVNNTYQCGKTPIHMSSATSKADYVMPYGGYFGGVNSITADHYKKINGMSNLYFGWGGEDDDFRIRVEEHKLGVGRLDLETGRYYALGHKEQKPNAKRMNLLKKGKKRMDKDGLNSLAFKLADESQQGLFTNFTVYLQNT